MARDIRMGFGSSPPGLWRSMFGARRIVGVESCMLFRRWIYNGGDAFESVLYRVRYCTKMTTVWIIDVSKQ